MEAPRPWPLGCWCWRRQPLRSPPAGRRPALSPRQARRRAAPTYPLPGAPRRRSRLGRGLARLLHGGMGRCRPRNSDPGGSELRAGKTEAGLSDTAAAS